MINIVKDISESPTTIDEILQAYRVVEESYVPTLDEEFVVNPINAEYLYINSRIDIIQYRQYLMDYCCTLLVWATLPEAQRDKCIQWYQKPDEVAWEATDYTDIELKIIWRKVVKAEQDARKNRLDEGLALISWSLTKPEAMDFWLTVNTIVYDWLYADLPLLYCYINNLALDGTPFDFTLTGFNSKPYYSVEKKDLLNSIILR